MSQYSFRNARSVPHDCVTSHWSGVKRFLRSSLFSKFGFQSGLSSAAVVPALGVFEEDAAVLALGELGALALGGSVCEDETE